jgi:large subunit ribosomal protein L5
MNATAPPARLKLRYLDEIRPALIGRFGYSSVMQAPRLEKITLNMGVGSAKQDNKALKAAQDQLATIAGQRPSIRRARKSIAAFKLREGMPVGVAVTLRGERGYEFLDRLISIAIPRIRDFRGLNPRSFDGRGNYSLGVREQIIFPEIDYDAIDEVRGLDITVTTSAKSDPEAFALLFELGMPFARQGRPGAFNAVVDDPVVEEERAARARQSAPAAPAPEPAAEQAVPDEPVAAAEAPAAEEPAAAAEATGAEEPAAAAEAPAAEEPAAAAEATGAEEPAAAEEGGPDQASAAEASAADASAGEPSAARPVTDAPSADETGVEESSAEESPAEEAAAQQANDETAETEDAD